MKVIAKPVEISAEQYKIGKTLEGVTVVKPYILFSKSGKEYYVSHTPKIARDWISVEVDPKSGKRDAWSFAIYNLKSGERVEIYG